MNAKWKELLQKLQRPKGGFLAVWYVLTALCCAGAITFAVLGPQSLFFAVFSYVFYGLAAVTFGYTVYTIVIFAPSIKAGLTRWIKKSAFGRKMLEQYGFRTIIFAFCTLIFNVAYVLLHVVLAIVYGSFWYGSLAWYYGLLVFLRSGIVFYHRKKSKNGIFDREEQARTEFRKYCVCGVSLTVIPLILLIPILQIIFLDKAFVYEGWTVIAFAAYAFYKIIMAIYNAVKAQKQSDLTVEAVRNVGLADALVSIFALQTSLLFAFSEGSNYAWANVATGSAVCVLTVAIGVFMLVKARKKRKETEDGRKEEYDV